MLATLLKRQRARFTAVAQAWLSSGATAFEVWDDGRAIARWASEYHADDPVLSVPIGDPESTTSELRLYGNIDRSVLPRLQADSGMIDQMLLFETDLQSMTADLVASQDQLVAMYQLSQSLRRHVQVEETLQRVVEEAVRLARASSGFAVMLRPDGVPIVMQHPKQSVDEKLIWQTFWQGHANGHDSLLTAETNPDVLPNGVRNLFFTPFQVRNTLSAGLGLLNKKGSGFTAPDIKLIHAVVQQSSAHIENVLLYQETVEQAKLQTEVELAQRVQLQLLPQHVPVVPGIDVYAHSRPASQVGGDFFDFVANKQRPFTFVIGDVTGKGISAALLMTMARTAIHSKAAFMPNPTPEAVMRNSNEDLYDDFTHVGMFATVFIGQYLAAQRQLMYANAGHSPVIYCPAGGSARLLQADSTPIGVLNISLCRDHVLPFGTGDLLVAATDGFTDVRNGYDDMFGYDRLINAVERFANGSAKTIAEALFEQVSGFSGGRMQDDDQTLIVIKGV